MTKDEALKKMQAVKSYMTSGNPIWSVVEMGEAFDMAIEALEQPEHKMGKWEHPNRCSECGFGVLLSPYMHNLDTGEYTLLYKFCPNCGAKMEGEKDETY